MKTETEWKTGQVWIRHLEFFWKPILLHNLENFLTWSQDSYLRLSVDFSRLINQNITSIEIQKKMEELGEKNENPCFENFSGVTGLILALGEGEESQGFLEV